ncbi:APC family permease (plasmid) [Sphingobium sp. SJ10-10]|uniref:APC family permease n=1 Tax=Sphingobium sp. SJ10-10 TaxID=3114999 RepID=UPI002E185921|nr:APC family permease [Sphingobium sp. SJ10-10]
MLTLSCLSPVLSVYGAGSEVLRQAGTAAGPLFLLGIAATALFVLVYAEFGAAFPYAGGDYVGVGSILGSWAGVVVLALWAVFAGPGNAFEAKIFAAYAHELLPMIPLSVLTGGALLSATAIALLAVRWGAIVTGTILAVEAAVIVVLIGAGFLSPARNFTETITHPLTMTAGGLIAPAASALALGAVSAFYAAAGGQQAIYFGEELERPHRRMGPIIIMAGLIGACATAFPVIAISIGANDLPGVLGSPAPIAMFAIEKLGIWAGTALNIGVVLAIFNALIVQVMAYSRLYFSLGRDKLFNTGTNRWLASVDGPSGVPRNATLAIAVYSALACFLDSRTLLIFMTGILVYGWSLVCISVLVGRYKGLTGGHGYWRIPLHPVAPVLGLVLAGAIAFANLSDRDAGRPSLIALGIVMLVAIAWYHLVLARRPGGWQPRIGSNED